MPPSRLKIGLLLFSLLVFSACGKGAPVSDTDDNQAASEIVVGELLYQENCAACHSNPDVRAPSLSALKAMSPDSLLAAMTTGKMAPQTAHMAEKDKNILADYLADGNAESTEWETAMRCPANIRSTSAGVEYVTGWGLDYFNSRYQSAEKAGISADDLPNLELVWAQAFPGVTEMRSQPVMTENTVYVGASTTRKIYAFDLASGCLKWQYEGSAAIRSALALGHMPETGRTFIYYGDVGGFVHAVDAQNGEAIWQAGLRSEGEESGKIIITGTPVQHASRIYVPGSSFEVSMASDANYECCRQHGLVRALDVATGQEIWTYHTTEPARPQGKSASGTQLWGPSGAPVWTTPAIDPARNVLYIGTGENYSKPTTKTSDAIIALDLDTGVQKWVFQATENDAYNLACNSWNGGKDGPNCPENPGPDFDFGASVIIAKDNQGKDILLAGQKSGDVWALDPDNNGQVLWNTKLSGGTPVGGVHWGMAVLEGKVFVPLADPEWAIAQWDYEPLAGLAALDISTGETLWRFESSRGCFVSISEIDMKTGSPKVPWPDCPLYYGNSGAALVLDDMVLAGTLNGKLQAFDPQSGRMIWEYNTKQAYETLNGVDGHGGSLDNAGSVAVGNGYMVVQSGYSYINQMPGNVVLVFRKRQ